MRFEGLKDNFPIEAIRQLSTTQVNCTNKWRYPSEANHGFCWHFAHLQSIEANIIERIYFGGEMVSVPEMTWNIIKPGTSIFQNKENWFSKRFEKLLLVNRIQYIEWRYFQLPIRTGRGLFEPEVNFFEWWVIFFIANSDFMKKKHENLLPETFFFENAFFCDTMTLKGRKI